MTDDQVVQYNTQLTTELRTILDRRAARTHELLVFELALYVLQRERQTIMTALAAGASSGI